MRFVRLSPLAVAIAALASLTLTAGCDPQGARYTRPFVPGTDEPEPPYTPHPQDPPQETPDDPPVNECPTPACDADLTIDPLGPAMVVTDPVVLQQFSAQALFAQLALSGGGTFTADDVAARLFDTFRPAATSLFPEAAHCDTLPEDGLFHDVASCDRPEADLVIEGGFFTAGHPNELLPVAIVNRFDLATTDGRSCGQYRIVYAMRSGLTDPDRRFLMIVEPNLPAGGQCLEACRPVAEMWKSLEKQSPEEQATTLHTFFFEGMNNHGPVLDLSNLVQPKASTYGDPGGEGHIRFAMKRAGSPWAWRQVHLDPNGGGIFAPVALRNVPVAELFDPTSEDPEAPWARLSFLKTSLHPLASKDIVALHMATASGYDAVESELDGDGRNDYFDQATAGGDLSFLGEVQSAIDKSAINEKCAPDDYLDAEDILHRAAMVSCAGCHAPDKYLGEGRSIGCGLTWPASLGEVHVDETGNLSPALKENFLPRRAKVLASFLSACSPGDFANAKTAGGGVSEVGLEADGLPWTGTFVH